MTNGGNVRVRRGKMFRAGESSDGFGPVGSPVVRLCDLYARYLGVCAKGANPVPLGFVEFSGMDDVVYGTYRGIGVGASSDNVCVLGHGGADAESGCANAVGSGGSSVVGSVYVGDGHGSVVVDESSVVTSRVCQPAVGETMKQKKKKKRELERKKRREAEWAAFESTRVAGETVIESSCVESVVGETDCSESSGVSVPVPEWRRKREKVVECSEFRRREDRMRLSKFAGCSKEVRDELLETQAKRYIEENKAAVFKSQEQSRRIAAGLKAGVPERNVEVQRLQLDKRMNKFAEEYMKDDDGVSRVKTVLSEGLEDIIAVPVMSEGSSVSPDSSISVAQVNKMIKLIHGQASENEELRKAMGKLGIDDSGIASATSVEPALTGYGFFPAEDDLAHQLEFYSDY